VLAALAVHLGAFAVFHAGAFDAPLGLAEAREETAAPETSEGEPPAEAPAEEEAAEGDAADEPAEPAQADPWWTPARAERTLRYARPLMTAMRLAGLVSGVLLLVTLFVYLQVSLLGRLAGVQFLTQAFFLTLFLVATAYSWEPVLPGTRILGSLYRYHDLLNSYTVLMQRGEAVTFGQTAYYFGRFLVMPVVSLVLLIICYLKFRRGYEASVLMNE